MSEDVECPKCEMCLYLPWSEYDYSETFEVECDCGATLIITAETSVSFSAAVKALEQARRA